MHAVVRSWWRIVLSWRTPRKQPLWLEHLESRNLWTADTLGTAAALSFLPFGTGFVAHSSGFLSSPNQVDLYKLSQLQVSDQVSLAVNTQNPASGLESVLRVFDATGKKVALDDQEGGDPSLTFQAATAGDYFVGVSSAGDDRLRPNVAGTGHGGDEHRVVRARCSH